MCVSNQRVEMESLKRWNALKQRISTGVGGSFVAEDEEEHVQQSFVALERLGCLANLEPDEAARLERTMATTTDSNNKSSNKDDTATDSITTARAFLRNFGVSLPRPTRRVESYAIDRGVKQGVAPSLLVPPPPLLLRHPYFRWEVARSLAPHHLRIPPLPEFEKIEDGGGVFLVDDVGGIQDVGIKSLLVVVP